MASIRLLSTAAAVAGLIAVLPTMPGVQASRADRTDDSFDVVCSGKLNVAITAVDGRPVPQTRWVALHDPPTQSTFVLTHVLTVHNLGTVAVRTLSLVTLPGWTDSSAFAGLVSADVASSTDDFATSRDVAHSLVSLEWHPISLPLGSSIAPGADLQIRVRLSADDLDNSLQGASVKPSMSFVVGG